ncbi:MAG: hypothetical protein WDW38_005607 [Sanguina aurantia]
MAFKKVLTRSFSGDTTGFTCKSAARQVREPAAKSSRRYNCKRIQAVDTGPVAVSPEPPSAALVTGTGHVSSYAADHMPRARVLQLMQQLGDSLITTKSLKAPSISTPGNSPNPNERSSDSFSSIRISLSGNQNHASPRVQSARPNLVIDTASRLQVHTQLVSSPPSARTRSGLPLSPSSALLPSSWTAGRSSRSASGRPETPQLSSPTRSGTPIRPQSGSSPSAANQSQNAFGSDPPPARPSTAQTPEMRQHQHQQHQHDQEQAAIHSLYSISGRDYEDDGGWEEGEVASGRGSRNDRRSTSVTYFTASAAQKVSPTKGGQGSGGGSSVNNQRRTPDLRHGGPDPREDPSTQSFFIRHLAGLRPTTSYMRETVAAARAKLQAARSGEDISIYRSLIQLPALESAPDPPSSQEVQTQTPRGQHTSSSSPDMSDGVPMAAGTVDANTIALHIIPSRSRCDSSASNGKARAQLLASLSTLMHKVSPANSVAVEDMTWMERCCSPEFSRRSVERRLQPRPQGARGNDAKSRSMRLPSKSTSVPSEIMSMIQELEAYEISEGTNTPKALLSLNSMERASQPRSGPDFYSKPSPATSEYASHHSRVFLDKVAASAAQPFVRYGLAKKSSLMSKLLLSAEET